jgi:hypothetical protein
LHSDCEHGCIHCWFAQKKSKGLWLIFLCAEGVKWVEIHRCLSAKCGERKIVTGCFLLLHNTYLHSAAHTKKTFQELKVQVINHTPFCPDLTPSDLHLFRSLRQALKGCWFAEDYEGSGAWLALHSTFLGVGGGGGGLNKIFGRVKS